MGNLSSAASGSSRNSSAMEEPALLRWKCVGGHDNWRGNEFEFRLSLIEGVTQLKFLQDYSRELDDVQYGIYNFNWGYYLESLRQCCEEGKGKPFDARKDRTRK